MTNWQGILELLGVSAALIGLVTAARSAIMLLFPEKKFKTSGIRQKQALIADNSKAHDWTDTLGITLLVTACASAVLSRILKAHISFVDLTAMFFAVCAPLAVAYQSCYAIIWAYESKRLGKALEKKGFEVSICHKANVDWNCLVSGLTQGAGEETISLIRINSHGTMISKKSHEFEGLQKKE